MCGAKDSMSFLDLRWRKKKPTPPAPTPAPPPVVPPVGPSRPVRVTADVDGEILNRTYPYWPAAWVEPDGKVLCFVGHTDGRPRFFRVDLASGHAQRLGPLLNYTSTGEGVYFDARGELYLCDGPRLRRVQPLGTADTVVLDISETHPGCRLFQAHSDDSGLCHSATVERITSDGPYERIGTVVQCLSGRLFFQAIGTLDESAVTSDGAFLIIKEDDDNRVIDLTNGSERRIGDRDRALGHSDCGASFMVGEADKPDPGACVYWDLRQPLTVNNCRLLFPTLNMGHISVRGGRWLLSDATNLNISLVSPDGSVTVLHHHGIDSAGDYDKQVRAAMSPCGKVASYVADGVFYLLPVP